MNAVDFELSVLGVSEWNPADDNVDVEVKFSDGSRFTATFFTVCNIHSLFAKNKITGECSSGKYLWATEMILVERLDRQTMEDTIFGLIRDGEFEDAFTKVSDVARLATD